MTLPTIVLLLLGGVVADRFDRRLVLLATQALHGVVVGAIALLTALRYPERLAGVMALSTYLPLAPKLATERSEANSDLPIFMAHGSYDDIIPIQRARDSKELLEKAGYRVEWHEYPMPHSVCGEEVRDISSWLSRLL
jgi:phospholipase/carboxylesterase